MQPGCSVGWVVLSLSSLIFFFSPWYSPNDKLSIRSGSLSNKLSLASFFVLLFLRTLFIFSGKQQEYSPGTFVYKTGRVCELLPRARNSFFGGECLEFLSYQIFGGSQRIAIGRASRPFPRSKPSGHLSMH